MSAPQSRTRSGLPDAHAAVELARVELVRGLRWTAAQDFWVLYGAASGLALLFGSWVAFGFGRDAGAALAAGESTWFVTGGAATLWSVVWLFTATLLVADAVGSNGDVANGGHYLTIRPTCDVAVGKLLAAACKFAVFVYFPALAWFAGIAVGAGTPAPLVGATAAATVTVLSATAVGYPVGFALKGGIRRSETLTRLKPVLAVAVGAGYVVVMVSGEFVAAVEAIAPALRAPPLGWLADLSLATTPGADASPAGAAGALATSVVAVASGTWLTTRTATYAWRADRVQAPTEDDEPTTAPDHRIDDALAAVTLRPATRGIASTTLLRVVRSPLQLVFVAFPLVGAIPLGEQLLATGSLPWYAPWLAVWYGAWAAGAAIPLNPIGNQGATLPALLTAPADAKRVVHGHVVAAGLVAAPATAGVSVALAAAGSRPAVELVVVGVVAVLAVVAACVLAVGVGSVFPRFETVDFAGSRRALPPSKVAYGAFSAVLTMAVVAAVVVADDLADEVVSVLLSRRLPFGATVGSDTLVSLAWVVLVATAVAVPVAYRVGVERVRRYRLS